jgi:FKBP-type peptidyl-prolyl cis-trans isomerase FkpA
MKNLLFLIVPIIITACSTYSDQDLTSFDSTIKKYIARNKIKLDKTDSGLYFKTTAGTGKKIRYQDSVSISYTGKLLSGKLVDIQKNPITFAVKDLIMGWKEALIMSQKGSEITMIIPPNLGYGDHTLEQIPQNAILIFDLKVWDVK